MLTRLRQIVGSGESFYVHLTSRRQWKKKKAELDLKAYRQNVLRMIIAEKKQSAEYRNETLRLGHLVRLAMRHGLSEQAAVNRAAGRLP